MEKLRDALESFNRKERNLLVRAALGHGNSPLLLSATFREGIAKALGIGAIGADAWWATDYHFSWLAGALAIYFEDQEALREQGRSNPGKGKTPRRLVEGHQEDVDLVIASGQDLILIEAKAYGAWNNDQIDRKLERLDLLLGYHDTIRQSHDQPVNLHFLLASLREPEQLKSAPKPWSKDGIKLPWVLLDSHLKEPIRMVTRCDDQGAPSAAGDRWRVMRSRLGVAGWKRELDGDLRAVDIADH